MKIEILGANEVERLPGSSDTSARVAARYVAALVKAGPRVYVDNADVTMKALVIEGKVLPLVINRGAAINAHICSPSTHYVDYTLEELAKRDRSLPLWLLRCVTLPIRAALTASAINKTVMINNWLLPTNPASGLSSPQIAALTERLTVVFPESAIVFPSVNPVTDRAGFDALRENRYKLVRSRRVYVLDAGHRPLRVRNAARDLRLLSETPYEIVDDQDALQSHAARLAALYRDLYVVKHSRLNPQFNARFILLTLKERVFTYRALARDGRIDAFVSYFREGRVMTGAILGYDRSLPRRLGLYRLAFAILIAEGLREGSLLNLSAGAGEFKMLRGCVPVEEFDAVYDHHLPGYRRAAWATLRIGGEWAGSRGSPRLGKGAVAEDQIPYRDRSSGKHLRQPVCALWRAHSDAVNEAFLASWWPARDARRVLKTDLFDEAVAPGLYPSLASRASTIVGIDLSASVVGMARARYHALSAVAADVRELPFPADTFDVIVSNSTLDHFEAENGIVTSLRELRRVLRTGGHLVLTLDNRTKGCASIFD